MSMSDFFTLFIPFSVHDFVEKDSSTELLRTLDSLHTV